MDINYLLHRHQVSLMRADGAACSASRAAHHSFARHYAQALEALVQPLRQVQHPLLRYT